MKSGVAEPNWQRGNIVPLFSMFTESLQQLADSRQVTLAYEPAGTEQETDYVSDYMQKIVINLLSNALKNTEAGGSVTLSSRCTGNNFVFTVSDTGCGIATEDLPHIFEPFYMGRNSQTANSTGIGLALTKQLVEAMHGTIGVESALGEGTTFTVSLPQQQDGVDVERTAVTQTQENDSFNAEGGLQAVLKDSPVDDDSRTRILIVEDNREVAYYTGTLLTPHYEVFYATDGEEGLEKARQLMPDVVITDVMMPRMDGMELCRRIRQDELTCHIPVIVVTAKVTEKDRLEGLHAGATAYLNKPFNAEELLTMVGNLLQQQREIQKRFMRETGKKEVNEEVRLEVIESEMNELDHQFLKRLKDTVTEEMGHGNTDAERLASLMAMSQTQLRRKISAVTGISAARYVTLLRIEKAKELLKEYPKVTIIEVAYRTGFADNAHFTKVFHRVTGITPMQFIRETQNKA